MADLVHLYCYRTKVFKITTVRWAEMTQKGKQGSDTAYSSAIGEEVMIDGGFIARFGFI